MTNETKDFRLDGIYRQRQDGFFMQRVKLPVGIISSKQARTVSEAAKRFGRDSIHLTSRGNMEIHWILESDLPEIKRLLTATGLTGRGACGGAVRGVTCSSPNAADFPLIEALARRIQRHFTGNPRFERLPKKFKIGIETDSSSRRHLIQDVGLVLVHGVDGRGWYDIWVAGGLGRDPQPGFLLAESVVEERIIPMIEAILRIYSSGTPAGKRLKHLLNTIGEDEFRQRLEADPGAREELPACKGIPEILVPGNDSQQFRIEAHFFAGGLSSTELSKLCDFADKWSYGVMVVTVDQNIAFPLALHVDHSLARQALDQAGFASASPEKLVNFRICPGTHECRAGLTPTRDIAMEILEAIGPEGIGLTWAISGCHNSCTQPQLAEIGIISARLVAGDDGLRTPRFDLYRSGSEGLGQRVESSLQREELLAAVRIIG